MDTKKTLILLDWRMYGDFSAVGQLTKKIFHRYKIDELIFIKTSLGNYSCLVFKISKDNFEEVFAKEVSHTAILAYLRGFNSNIVFYLRMSPCSSLLDLAIKLKINFKKSKFICHYMDNPDVRSLSESEKNILNLKYNYLLSASDMNVTIHESSKEYLEKKYGRYFRVLGNFIDFDKFQLNIEKKKKSSSRLPFKISFFGGVDEKMNYFSLLYFVKSIYNLKHIEFDIYTNSGIYGELKELVDSSFNVFRNYSDLEVDSYNIKLIESDFLLLPYNFNSYDQKYLANSFSNKLIDYIESGSQIIVLGPSSIPSIRFCLSYEVGVCFTSEQDDSLGSFLKSPSAMRDILSRRSSDKLINYLYGKSEDLFDFYQKLDLMFTKEPVCFSNKKNREYKLDEKILIGLLIRCKLYDKKNQKQSLRTSVLASILKNKGYQGLDYEI